MSRLERAGDGNFRIPPWRHRGLMLWSAILIFGVTPPLFILRVTDARWIGWLLISFSIALSAWNFFGSMTIAPSSKTLLVTWRLSGLTRRKQFTNVKGVRALERRLDRTRLFQGLAIETRERTHEVSLELGDDEIVTLARELDERIR